QMLVRQNARPNFWIDGIETRASSKPMPQTSRTSAKANAPVPSRKPRSLVPLLPILPLRRLDFRERHHLELHDALRQRRLAEIVRVFLTVGQRPLHELDERLGLRLVLGRFVE